MKQKKLLMTRLDQNLLDHAREICAGDGPRIVDTSTTYQEEADMYAALDTDKTPLTPRQHTKALVEAGSDPKIMSVRCKTLSAFSKTCPPRPG